MPSASPAPRIAESPGLVSVDGKTFPLRSARLESRAGSGLAYSTLVQEYANPWPEPLEVLYTLPLPADGAVLGYDIRLGERTIIGVIETREHAREKYTEALLSGHTAGLLEEERADTFTLTLGNLPPHAAARIEVRVLHRLAFRPGSAQVAPEWEYRFPTVVGVRYQGEPGRVPDASALDPDRAEASGTPTRLDLDLIVTDASAPLSPTSPSHELRVLPDDGGSRISLASAEKLDRDVVVRWHAAGAEIGARLTEGPGLPGDQGRYGLLTLVPPTSPRTVFPRDLTILLDASGSMAGRPIEQAKEIAATILRSLSPSDRFEVIAFANRTESLTGGMKSGNPGAIDKALIALGELDAGGGTEMADAVARALEPLRPDSQRQVVLITDGFIGFEHEIVGQVIRKLPANARLHVIGVGMAPNRTLTRGASRAGRGIEVIVGTREDAAPGAELLRQATTAPVLTDVVVRGTAVVGAAPEKPRDVFAGMPALVALELRPEGGTIEILGTVVGQDDPWREEIAVPPRALGWAVGSPLGALFGRELVDDCEMRLAAESPDSHGRQLDRIEKLGLRHRITTRRTSLVAISENPTVDPRDPRRRERLAVEIPLDVPVEHEGLTTGVHRIVLSQSLGVAEAAAYESGISHRVAPRRRWLGLRRIGPARSAPVTAAGRIVRHDDDTLVVELEVPPEGLKVPRDGATCTILGVTAKVIESLGTRPGRYEAGVTVRLAFRLDEPLMLFGVSSLHLSGRGLDLEIVLA